MRKAILAKDRAVKNASQQQRALRSALHFIDNEAASRERGIHVVDAGRNLFDTVLGHGNGNGEEIAG